MAFVHLHVHSEFSPLDGMIRIGDAFATAASLGQNAIAITDHGNLAAAWAAQGHADQVGVKFIAGNEMYLAIGSRHGDDVLWVAADDNSTDEDAVRGDDGDTVKPATRDGMKARPYMHLTVLAHSPEGWRNLVILNNKAQETIRHKPRIDLDLLAAHSEGLIVLTGCLGGPVLGPASRGEWDLARANLQAIIAAVGAENTYVEIMEHGIPEESAVLPQVVELAREHGVGVVATNDAHHTHETDAEAHAAWLLVQSKSTFDDPKFTFHGHGFWLRSEAEMRALRPEPWWQEACDTTQVIADRCAARTLPTHRDLMPRFPTPDGFADNQQYLFHLLRAGALKLYGGIDPELRERVMAEMDVIVSAGMVDYFLVVHDLINWARTNGILVGPGRGSAGGSEIAYLLGITLIPPRKYGLLFERFYEKGRSEPPDIDIDFPQGRRQEVIQYLRDRWGARYVASIGTFRIERTKQAINDAARVIGEQKTGTDMNKLVPVVEAKPMPTAELLNPDHPSTAEYRRLYEKDDVVRRVHGMAASFENVVAGFSVHASGVIVSSEPLEELVPLRRTSAGWVLQWTGPEAEQFGLLKVDVLGLRNLDIIERAVQYIEDTTGERVDPLTLPDPDTPAAGKDAARVAAAWKIIAEGRTAGVFQMESAKMTELAMQVAPRSLAEESAIVALYRPGPMGMGAHTQYAHRKRGIEPTDYTVFTSDPREQAELAKVLDETFGLIVYQEQIMALGTVMAGFDATGRSKLRKAVSKKKKADLEAIQPLFFEKATTELRDDAGNVTSIAFSPVTVQAVWDTVLAFAEYAFNKAHSATYGYLAFVTAFYKANWPACYAAANLAVTSKDDKRVQVLRSLAAEGLNVLPPDVNSTSPYTVPEGDTAIRLGLSEVKDLGKVGVMIAAERNRHGEYRSLRDVWLRVQKPPVDDGASIGASAVSATHLRALVNSGAVDRFGPRLGQLVVAGVPKVDLPIPAMEWSTLERSSRQRQALLIPLGEHPLVTLRDRVASYRIPSLLPGHPEFAAKPIPIPRIPDRDGEAVHVLGILASWTERAYSKGRLANIALEGSSASINGTIWDTQLTEIKAAGDVPNVGEIVVLKAKVRHVVVPADPEDPESEETSVKELSVSGITRIEVEDDSFGGLPRTTLPRLDLTELADLGGVHEPTAAEREAEPVAADTGDDVPMVFASAASSGPAPAGGVAVLPTSSPAVTVVEAPAPILPTLEEHEAAARAIEDDKRNGGAGIATHPSGTVVVPVPVLGSSTSGVWEVVPYAPEHSGLQVFVGETNRVVAKKITDALKLDGAARRKVQNGVHHLWRGAKFADITATITVGGSPAAVVKVITPRG